MIVINVSIFSTAEKNRISINMEGEYPHMAFAHELGHIKCGHVDVPADLVSKIGRIEEEVEAWAFAKSVVASEEFCVKYMWESIGWHVEFEYSDGLFCCKVV